MDRRYFLKFSALTMCGSTLIACDENPLDNSHKNIVIPEFSTTRLHSKLDQLLASYESKGINVSNSLLPALSEAEIREKCFWFPAEVPQEIIALYTWRGGQAEEACDSEHSFLFRDNNFCSLDIIKKEYKDIMEYYGVNPEDHLMLKYSFPFATFQGSWYVIPANKHNFNPSLKHPVIAVFEGIDVFFYSIESMIDICIDWINHPNYSVETHSLPRSAEMEIWQKHNPGIFTYN